MTNRNVEAMTAAMEEDTRGRLRRQLMRHGNLRVPCSRYGHDTATCSEVAIDAFLAYEEAVGESQDEETLEWLMGLVVNDHDDIAYLLGETP